VTETEYQKTKARVEREYPARQKLAKLAGLKLEDQTMLELYTTVCIVNQDKELEARNICQMVLMKGEDR
jgi:hypothetical protein